MEILLDEKEGAFDQEATPLPDGIHDPFAYMTKVIKEDYPVEEMGVSSLENNLIVMQILEAAKESAKTGQTILWEEFISKNDE